MNLEHMEGKELAGRFLLQRLVGQGGYGAVFEAVQLSVGRRCAVKVMLPELCEKEATARRFATEARAISQLVHANSVVLYDFGQTQGPEKLLYLVMEFLEGRDLNQFIEQEGPMNLETCVHIVRQIGGSLHEAHSQGLVHRDVKPHNIMLIERQQDPYYVKVIDFGIAKTLESSRLTMQQLTQDGTMIGTPHYMAPEQVLDRALDGRTDQYSLAITIYKMLVGRTPFQGTTAIEVASKQLSETPMPVSTYRKDLRNRGALERVLLRALSKEPAGRFSNMLEFVDAFAEAALIEDDSFYSGENTLVDTPSALQAHEVPPPQLSSDYVSGEDDGPEDADDAKSSGGWQDEEPGATLFVAQKYEPAVIVPASEQEGVPAEEDANNGLSENLEAKSVTVETRTALSEITSSMANPRSLLRAMIALTCVFMLVLAVILVRLLPMGGAEASPAVERAEVAEGGKNVAQIAGSSAEESAVNEASGGKLAEAAGVKPVVSDEELKRTAAVGQEFGLRVKTRAQQQVDTWQEQEKAAALARAEAAKKEAAKQPLARVRVTLIPWGTLQVNRRVYSDAPRQDLRLSPGRHTFILKQGDQEKVRKIVDVEAGSHTMVELVAR